MSKRKHCSAQPYLDYIGVSERERKKGGKKKEKLECAVCWGEMDEDSLRSRIKVTVGKVSYTPKTWDICSECRNRGAYQIIKELIDKSSESIYGRDKDAPQERKK